LWGAKQGDAVGVFLYGHTVLDVRFSPDGRRLAVAGLDGMIKVLDTRTLQVLAVLVGSGRSTATILFSPEGKRLLVADVDGKAQLWDLASARPRFAFNPVLRALHRSGVPSSQHQMAAFSPDGTRIVTGGPAAANVWDASTGGLLLRLQESGDVEEVA